MTEANMKRSQMVAIAAPALLAGAVLGGSVMAQDAPLEYSADLQMLNNSGATGTAMLLLDGDMLTVTIEATGLSPDLPHAQHIHGEIGADNTCPPPEADTTGDGFISVAEGAPFYGGILVSLTTSGETTPGDGLALDRMPTADASGNLSYSRQFAVSSEIAANLSGLRIVQHGIDLDDSGAYDGEKPSSIDPFVPFEATVPANCGGITLLSAPTTTQPATTQPATTQPGTTQPGTTQPAIAPVPQLPATGTGTDMGMLAAAALLLGGAALIGVSRRRFNA
jgi:LPXTG-motif cell wall-anchored protein